MKSLTEYTNKTLNSYGKSLNGKVGVLYTHDDGDETKTLLFIGDNENALEYIAVQIAEKTNTQNELEEYGWEEYLNDYDLTSILHKGIDLYGDPDELWRYQIISIKL